MKSITAVLLSAMLISGAAFAKGKKHKKHGHKGQSSSISGEATSPEVKK